MDAQPNESQSNRNQEHPYIASILATQQLPQLSQSTTHAWRQSATLSLSDSLIRTNASLATTHSTASASAASTIARSTASPVRRRSDDAPTTSRQLSLSHSHNSEFEFQPTQCEHTAVVIRVAAAVAVALNSQTNDSQDENTQSSTSNNNQTCQTTNSQPLQSHDHHAIQSVNASTSHSAPNATSFNSHSSFQPAQVYSHALQQQSTVPLQQQQSPSQHQQQLPTPLTTNATTQASIRPLPRRASPDSEAINALCAFPSAHGILPPCDDALSRVVSPSQFASSSHPQRKRGKWSIEEDEALRLAVRHHHGRNWKLIAQMAFGDRKSDVQCLHRFQKVLDSNLHKGPWSRKEDATVRSLVSNFGAANWSTVASYLPGRIGKQCRERWYNHLDPSIKRDEWTAEEDALLLLQHARLGNQWSVLSRYFCGRTDNAIKNHWNSALKTRMNNGTLGATSNKRSKAANTHQSNNSNGSSSAFDSYPIATASGPASQSNNNQQQFETSDSAEQKENFNADATQQQQEQQQEYESIPFEQATSTQWFDQLAQERKLQSQLSADTVVPKRRGRPPKGDKPNSTQATQPPRTTRKYAKRGTGTKAMAAAAAAEAAEANNQTDTTAAATATRRPALADITNTSSSANDTSINNSAVKSKPFKSSDTLSSVKKPTAAKRASKIRSKPVIELSPRRLANKERIAAAKRSRQEFDSRVPQMQSRQRLADPVEQESEFKKQRLFESSLAPTNCNNNQGLPQRAASDTLHVKVPRSRHSNAYAQVHISNSLQLNASLHLHQSQQLNEEHDCDSPDSFSQSHHVSHSSSHASLHLYHAAPHQQQQQLTGAPFIVQNCDPNGSSSSHRTSIDNLSHNESDEPGTGADGGRGSESYSSVATHASSSLLDEGDDSATMLSPLSQQQALLNAPMHDLASEHLIVNASHSNSHIGLPPLNVVSASSLQRQRLNSNTTPSAAMHHNALTLSNASSSSNLHLNSVVTASGHIAHSPFFSPANSLPNSLSASRRDSFQHQLQLQQHQQQQSQSSQHGFALPVTTPSYFKPALMAEPLRLPSQSAFSHYNKTAIANNRPLAQTHRDPSDHQLQHVVPLPHQREPLILPSHSSAFHWSTPDDDSSSHHALYRSTDPFLHPMER